MYIYIYIYVFIPARLAFQTAADSCGREFRRTTYPNLSLSLYIYIYIKNDDNLGIPRNDISQS